MRTSVIHDDTPFADDMPLERETVAWWPLSLETGGVYEIAIRVDAGPGAGSDAAVLLFDAAGDDGAPRNAWGALSPTLGRYRYLRPGAVQTLKITGDGRPLRVGVRPFRSKAEVRFSPTLRLRRLAEEMAIDMSPAEIETLSRLMDRARVYLEFGAGGSTALAAGKGLSGYSVESDPRWIERMRATPVVADAEAAGRTTLIHADIGPVGAYGAPADGGTGSGRWSAYFLDVWGRIDRPADLVLVDGRFRLACATAALIALPDALVAIHDVDKPGARRESYRRILEIAETVEQVESLLVVRRRPDWDAAKALALLGAGAAIPD